MSDGPHRSLPMRPAWKRVAERGDRRLIDVNYFCRPANLIVVDQALFSRPQKRSLGRWRRSTSQKQALRRQKASAVARWARMSRSRRRALSRTFSPVGSRPLTTHYSSPQPSNSQTGFCGAVGTCGRARSGCASRCTTSRGGVSAASRRRCMKRSHSHLACDRSETIKGSAISPGHAERLQWQTARRRGRRW